MENIKNYTVEELKSHQAIVRKKLEKLEAAGDDVNKMAVEHWENIAVMIAAEISKRK